jgi:hypothetical protein
MPERRRFKRKEFQEDERQFCLMVQACDQAIEILESEDKERLLALLLWQSPFDLLRKMLDSFTVGSATGQGRILRMSYTEAKVKPTKLNEMKVAWNHILMHFQFSRTFLSKPGYTEFISQLEGYQDSQSICCLYDFAQAMRRFSDDWGTAEKVIQRVGLVQSADILATSKTQLIREFEKIHGSLKGIAGAFGFSLELPTGPVPQ